MPPTLGVAVIADIVRSRDHEDRAQVQRELLTALRRVNDIVHAVQPFQPSVGDECQALYENVESAIEATLLLRLFLPPRIDCRFGIGSGEYRHVDSGGFIQDGSAWWSARQAIIEVKNRERRTPTLRTWYVMAPNPLHPSLPPEPMTNAYLLCRDQLVSTMSEKHQKRLLGAIQGHTQEDLGRIEGVSQPAVSQGMHRSGAYAVLDSSELLEWGTIA